jgi:DGQHR domain-containing protein
VPELPNVAEGALRSELSRLAGLAEATQSSRLQASSRELVQLVKRGALGVDEARSRAGEDYVARFVLDMVELTSDPEAFVAARRELKHASAQKSLLQSLYELTKPVLIVDGQHRLLGAAHTKDRSVQFLVCAIPNCSWEEQVYQFVVINERAEKVNVTLLYDIFGSSLTNEEADRVRRRLGQAGADVEQRIAAVVSYRDTSSPFFEMVRVDLPDAPEAARGYLSPRTIADLIEGTRDTRGFRTDDEFLEHVVTSRMTRDKWTSWNEGAWRKYWYAFWDAVREYFNEAGKTELWTPSAQTNLTKGVALRALQDLYLAEAAAAAKKTREFVAKVPDALKAAATAMVEETALPASVDAFRERILTKFLTGFPRDFFRREWQDSLDTSAGLESVRTVMRTTWEAYVDRGDSERKGPAYPYWSNANMFAPKKTAVE